MRPLLYKLQMKFQSVLITRSLIDVEIDARELSFLPELEIRSMERGRPICPIAASTVAYRFAMGDKFEVFFEPVVYLSPLVRLNLIPSDIMTLTYRGYVTSSIT